MKIRKAKKEDIKQLLELWKENIRHHTKFNKELYTPYARSKIEMKTQAGVIMKALQSKNRNFLVAEDSGKIIGYIWGVVKKEDRLVGAIADIMVTYKYRRKGIGKKLIKEMLKFFKSKRCKASHLFVYVKNIPAKKTYSSLGFKEEVVMMKKKL